MRRALLILCLINLATVACTVCARADVVTDWNTVILDTIRSTSTSPPVASRAMAIMHTAIYDSVNSVDRTHTPYRVDIVAPPGTSREAAAAAAAERVLSALYPSQTAIFQAQLAQSLADIPDGSGKDNGVALGRTVADEILAWRSTDGSDAVVPYTWTEEPGRWRPTPPAYAPALLPQWGYVTPFGIAYGSQFRTSGPPALDSAEYAAALNEIKMLGEKNSQYRDADQTEIALFWADGAGTVTPPGHWNQIAQQISTEKNSTLSENARLFALLNVALADAAIIAWDAKYTYDFWRPITAVREAHQDGNPLTDPDEDWEPLLVTPPFPEYVSGHSTFSGAASGILALIFGDDTSFVTGSDELPGVNRSFSSFSEAALEAGRSRIYGGIHYEFSNTPAVAAGQEAAEYIYGHYMTLIPEPSSLVALCMAIAAFSGALIRKRRI